MNIDFESVLRELVEKHFYSKELEWSWREGISLLDIDPDLHAKIVTLLPDVVAKL